LSELEFSTSLIKLTVSFLTDRKFIVLVEGEFSMPRKIVAGILQGSVLAPVFYAYYKLYPHDTWNSALFVDDTCIYATGKHECYVLCKLQCKLTAVNS
jgi:hypothetical protein